MHTARNINDHKPLWVIQQVEKVIGEFLVNNTDKCEEEVILALYGLAFKANIDDLRGSPALAIASEIGRIHKGIVYAVEPNIRNYDQTNFDLVSVQKAYSEADIHVLLVPHTEFENPKLSSKYFLDTCGLWS
jgi:UDP-N-acetyl-D-mannosaminuronic acid dehydrogenase